MWSAHQRNLIARQTKIGALSANVITVGSMRAQAAQLHPDRWIFDKVPSNRAPSENCRFSGPIGCIEVHDIPALSELNNR